MKRGWNWNTAIVRELLAVGVVVLHCAVAFGEEDASAPSPAHARGNETVSALLESVEPASAPTGSMTGAFLRMIGWTVALVAVAAALLLALKRFTPAGRLFTGGGVVDVLARSSLSPRHNVFVLKVARQRVLIVGVSGDRMVTLSEISDPSDVLAFDGSFQKQLDDATSEGVKAASRSQDFPAVAGDVAGGESAPGGGDDLHPYRNEILRLKGMISGWKNVVGSGYSGASDDQAARREARNQ